jgi:NADH-quinone oxidoreductase subunit N
MLLLVEANHLISAFLCVVGFSLNLYVLILYDIAVRPSREAGLKYYYLSTLSSGLILYGAFMLYALSGDGEFSELHTFFLQEGLRYSALARVAVMLTIFGFFFKLSAVPAHL